MGSTQSQTRAGAAPQPGALIEGRWQLVRRLGEGATGSVWEAESVQLRGRVAIKFLASEHLADATMRKRFQREAAALCRVRSPHVVQVLDHGVTGNVPYLIMELLEGEDLGHLLERERTLSLAEVASMLDQLGRGLTRAHAAGFVHRDIKPNNVFVIHESDGGHFVKLLDFGIVKKLDAQTLGLTERDTILGSAHYLSPEQIESPQTVDARSDVWSLGVLAYRMLTGRLPYDAASPPELYARILEGRFTPATSIRPDLPIQIDRWFAGVLEISRKHRAKTAQAATAALVDIARAVTSNVKQKAAGPRDGGDRDGAAEQTSHETVDRSPLKRRTVIALIGFAAAVALFAVVRLSRSPSPERAEATRSASADSRKNADTISTVFAPSDLPIAAEAPPAPANVRSPLARGEPRPAEAVRATQVQTQAAAEQQALTATPPAAFRQPPPARIERAIRRSVSPPEAAAASPASRLQAIERGPAPANKRIVHTQTPQVVSPPLQKDRGF